MELLFFVAPLPSWQHRDSFVVDAFATKFCVYLGTAVTRHSVAYDICVLVTQHLLPGLGTIHTSMMLYPAVGMDS